MPEPPASVSDIKITSFSTRSQQRGDALIVAMSGNADMAAHDQLKVFLDEVHRTAAGLGVRETVLELQDLYFMNSSCLSLLLRLVNSVLQSKHSKYILRFRLNPNLRWQKRSMDAIRSYAEDVVVVE
jgi:anti-anti-sigma factor